MSLYSYDSSFASSVASLDEPKAIHAYASLLNDVFSYFASMGIDHDMLYPAAMADLNATPENAAYLKAFHDSLSPAAQRKTHIKNAIIFYLRTGQDPEQYVRAHYGKVAHEKVLLRLKGIVTSPIEVKSASTSTGWFASVSVCVRGIICLAKTAENEPESIETQREVSSFSASVIQAPPTARLSMTHSLSRSTKLAAPAEKGTPAVLIASDSLDALLDDPELGAAARVAVGLEELGSYSPYMESLATFASPVTLRSTSSDSVSTFASSISDALIESPLVVADSPTPALVSVPTIVVSSPLEEIAAPVAVVDRSLLQMPKDKKKAHKKPKQVKPCADHYWSYSVNVETQEIVPNSVGGATFEWDSEDPFAA